jgi:hypothetical protein
MPPTTDVCLLLTVRATAKPDTPPIDQRTLYDSLQEHIKTAGKCLLLELRDGVARVSTIFAPTNPRYYIVADRDPTVATAGIRGFSFWLENDVATTARALQAMLKRAGHIAKNREAGTTLDEVPQFFIMKVQGSVMEIIHPGLFLEQVESGAISDAQAFVNQMGEFVAPAADEPEPLERVEVPRGVSARLGACEICGGDVGVRPVTLAVAWSLCYGCRSIAEEMAGALANEAIRIGAASPDAGHISLAPYLTRVRAVDILNRRRMAGEVINFATHVGHCCLIHGCKYGDKYCPVTAGVAPQEYPCEDCSIRGVETLDEVAMVAAEPPGPFSWHWAEGAGELAGRRWATVIDGDGNQIATVPLIVESMAPAADERAVEVAATMIVRALNREKWGVETGM